MSDSVGSVSVDVVPDARGWAEKLRAQIRDVTIRAKIEPQVDPAAEQAVGRKGKSSAEKFAGEFDRTVQTRIRAALAALPDAKIGADASEADQKLAGLRAELQALSDQKLGVDVSTDEALAKIAQVRTELASLAAGSPDVRVNVDALAASAQLAAIQAQAAGLDGKTATVRVKVERSAISRATGALDGFIGKIGLLPGLAIAAGAALIPLAASLGGVVAALGAPLAIAGGGATLYGFLLGAAVKQTEAQKKKIDTLAKAVATAKTSLANTQAAAKSSAASSTATAQASAAASLKSAQQSAANSISAAKQAEAAATTAAGRQAARARIAAAQRTLAQREAAIHTATSTRQSSIAASQSASVEAAQRKVNEATKAYKDALHALSPDQQKFLDAQDKIKGAFQNFIDQTGPALLGPATQFLHLLTNVLPSVKPIIDAFGGALGDLFDQLGKAAKSDGFARFVRTFAQQVGPDLKGFAHIIGNLATGFGGLFIAIDKKSGSGGMLDALDRMTHNFSKWANSKDARHDVRKFFDYFHQVGPQVAHTIGAVARALGKVVEALAPLGPVVLKGIEGVASGLAAIPIPVLTALAAAFAGLVGFQKVGGFKVAGFLTKGLGERGSTPANPLFVLDVSGGAGGGGVVGDLKKGGKFALIPELAVLIAAAAVDYKGAKYAYNSVGESSSRFAFGQAVPTMGGPSSHVDPKTRAAVIRQQQQLFAMDGGGNSSLNSTTTHFDALKASAQQASRQIDMIGPHSVAAFNQADKALDGFRLKLAAMHDKQLRIILQDEAAVRELERIQAMRLDDKHLNIYARYQGIERTPGPGGGMGQLPHGSGGGGSGSGGSGARRAGPTYTGDIHIRANDYRDLTQQMEARHRRAALDGVG